MYLRGNRSKTCLFQDCLWWSHDWLLCLSHSPPMAHTLVQRVLFLLLIARPCILQLWISSDFFYFRPQGGQVFFPCLKGGNFLCPHPNSSTQCVSSKALLYVRGERQNTFILVINRNPNKLYFLDRGWRKLCGNSPFILLKWIAIWTLQMKRYVHITDPSKGMCEQRHKDALYVKEAPEAHIPLLCMSLNHELQCHLTESPSGLLILSSILDRPSFHLYAWHL